MADVVNGIPAVSANLAPTEQVLGNTAQLTAGTQPVPEPGALAVALLGLAAGSSRRTRDATVSLYGGLFNDNSIQWN